MLVQDCIVPLLWCTFDTLLSLPFTLPWINLLTEYFCPLVMSRPQRAQPASFKPTRLFWLLCLCLLPWLLWIAGCTCNAGKVQTFRCFHAAAAWHLNSVSVPGAYLGFSFSAAMFSRMNPKSVFLNHQMKKLSVHVNAGFRCITFASSWLFVLSISSFSVITFLFLSLCSISFIFRVLLLSSPVWVDESWQTPVNPLSGLAH